MESVTDYRRLAQHRRGLYFTGPDACDLLKETFVTLTNNNPIQRTEVAVQMGRKLTVRRAGEWLTMRALRVLASPTPDNARVLVSQNPDSPLCAGSLDPGSRPRCMCVF